jgi:hypothetical protein
MAIKITDSIQTDKGVTTSLYLNISDVSYDKKNESILVMVKTYLNESERTVNDRDTCKTFVLKGNYSFRYLVSELTTNAFELAYTKLNDKLVADGHTTVSV